MIWNNSLKAFIPRNPIILRDLRYQQRTTLFLKGFVGSVGIVVVALCITIAMLFCVVYGLSPRVREDYLVSVQYLAWIFHLAAILRFLAAGVFNGAQDSGLRDSEDLMLTPLTNWQLLSGKWWAAMHQVRGWMLALGIVQMGIVVSTGFGLLMTLDWHEVCGSPCVVTINGLYKIDWFTPTRSILYKCEYQVKERRYFVLVVIVINI